MIQVTLKLYYFDHKVPSDWQPTFFQDATGHDDVLFEPDDEVTSTQLGATSTMYHRIKLKAVHRKDMDLIADIEPAHHAKQDSTSGSRAPAALAASVKAPPLKAATGSQPGQSADQEVDPQLQKLILQSGSVHMGSLAKQLDLPIRIIQQACGRLAKCGFLEHKPGAGIRYKIQDAGAQPSYHETASAEALQPEQAAHLDAMWLLTRLHESDTPFVTCRDVTEKHGITDKGIASATLVWLEKQGCLKACKGSNKGRQVLQSAAAKAKLCAFQEKLRAAAPRYQPPLAEEDECDISTLVQEAAARHKAQVAAMYASAEAARQVADETPHVIGGDNPTNHSANRNRTYVQVNKAEVVVSTSTATKLASHESGKLRTTGALPPAGAGAGAAGASPAGPAAPKSAALSPLNVTEGIETPGLSEHVPAKRSRNGLCGQRTVVTALAPTGSGTSSPPDSVSKTLTRTGRIGRRPRTSTVSMAVRQPAASQPPRRGAAKRSRRGARLQADDEFSFTD